MLLDTSGLLCLHYKTEPLHTQACTAYKKSITHLNHSYIISDYVLNFILIDWQATDYIQNLQKFANEQMIKIKETYKVVCNARKA